MNYIYTSKQINSYVCDALTEFNTSIIDAKCGKVIGHLINMMMIDSLGL